jgi:hypothetical protein
MLLPRANFKLEVFIFKMSADGVGSEIGLVAQMQPGGDLENSLIVLDHVKCVIDWTRCAMYMF